MYSVGLCAQLACVWETTARNPGNAHRFYDFEDASYVDFLISAAAIAPILETASTHSVGETVLDGVKATRALVSCNTNLGILLLLAPLAAVPREQSLADGLSGVMETLTLKDAVAVYEAIRLAAPAGLGHVAQQDIRDEPTVDLRQAMALAADRDIVARQYINGFHDLFHVALPFLEEGLAKAPSFEDVLLYCHVALLAAYPDSLIARKCGLAEAEQASRRAQDLLSQINRDLTFPKAALAKFDIWLRSPGRARNPGTTSDLVTACLFVGLRERIIQMPLALPWSHHE